MGRGWRAKTDPDGVSADGMRGGAQDKVAGAHYAEHQENFWSAIRGVSRSIREARGLGELSNALREGTDRIGRSLGADGEGVRSGLARVGLAGLAAGAGAVTISPAAALLAPAAGAALAWKAYNSWNTAQLWRNSTIGRALAESFGVNRAGKINSIGDTLAKRSLSGLGVAGASTLTLGTPLAPVAAAAIAGYAGYKAVQVAANKRSIEKEEEGANNEVVTPNEPRDEEVEEDPIPKDTTPSTPAEEQDTSLETPPPVKEEAEPAPEEVSAENTDNSESPREDTALENESSEEAPEENTEDDISPIDRLALEQVAIIEAEAEKMFEADVSSELGQVAVAEGRNFAEGMSPDAAEASMLSLLAESEFIPEDESGDEIRALVAANIEANILSKDKVKAIKAELEEADNIKNQCIENLQQINANLEEIKASGHIDPEEVQSLLDEREEYLQDGMSAEAKGNRIKAEIESLSSPIMSQIGGIANLSALGGELRCARCGTRPQTVRQRCSKCGLPFIVSPNQRQYVGVGDEGLREMGKMDLVEQYEGDSETRELRRKARLDGKYIYFPPGGEGAETVGQDGKKPSKKNSEGSAKKSPEGSAGSSSGSSVLSSREAVKYSKWSAEDTLASLQPQGEYDRDKYLGDQASLRSGDDPERAVFLVGHDPTTKGTEGENADLSQGQAMMRGVLGWDWNKSGGDIQPGDTVAVRNNKKGKKPSSIAGFFTVGDKIEITLPSMNEISALEDEGADKIYDSKGDPDPAGVEQMLREHRPEIMAALENVADKVMEGTDPQYYSRERVIGNILGDLARTQSSTFSFLQVADPHELEDYEDAALQGGKNGLGQGTATLNGPDEKGTSRIQRTKQVRESKEKAEAAEKLMRTIEEKRADDVESNKGSYPEKNFNRDSKGLPRVCGVKTAMGTHCRNPAARGSNYCWQHPNGPRKDRGETTLSREEIDISARNARNRELLDKAPALIRGQAEAEAYIDSLDNDPNSESNKELIAQCGMTHRELAEYANSFLDACRPDENDEVVVQLTHMDQIPLAEEIAKVAKARGISHELWYPTGDNKEFGRREEKVKDPRVISAYIDQVGGEGKRVIEDKTAALGYREVAEGDVYENYVGTEGRWNSTMTPTTGWAQLLADNHELTGFSKNPAEALRQLGQDMHRQSHSHEGINGLRRHVEDLDAKAARMQDLGINKIRIHSPETESSPGTELTMEMTSKSRWSSVDIFEGEEDVLLNTVTEEVWGTPVAGSLRGHFTTSAPTNITAAGDPGADPVIIEQMRGEFDENGELRTLQAYKKDESGKWVKDEEGQRELEAYFWPERKDADGNVVPPGRPMGKDGKPEPFPQCGELGIVDSENPVGSTGRNYLVPMIDEHGGFHIALGESYEMNGGGSANGGSPGPSDNREKPDPRNPAGRHLDITLGSMDASIFGTSSKTGEEVAIIDKGRFVI